MGTKHYPRKITSPSRMQCKHVIGLKHSNYTGNGQHIIGQYGRIKYSYYLETRFNNNND